MPLLDREACGGRTSQLLSWCGSRSLGSGPLKGGAGLYGRTAFQRLGLKA